MPHNGLMDTYDESVYDLNYDDDYASQEAPLCPNCQDFSAGAHTEEVITGGTFGITKWTELLVCDNCDAVVETLGDFTERTA